jgi:dynein regulatory complex protein 1
VQKEACKQIIRQKDELIQSFIEQLRGKDDEYVKSVRKQNDDIDELIKNMRK